ncbi:formyl transferase [Coprinopsis sp. MPI-PUGE-AT-0042]|nr:formyl transferase [Coprinopsis sp. MPI-PUGE-AT-0042]
MTALSRWACSNWRYQLTGTTQWRLHRYYHTSKPCYASASPSAKAPWDPKDTRNGDKPHKRSSFGLKDSSGAKKAPSKEKKPQRTWDRNDKPKKTWAERKAAKANKEGITKTPPDQLNPKPDDEPEVEIVQPSNGLEDGRLPTRSRLEPDQVESPEEAAKKLKVLFMGRDEFSCLVFQQLYAARDVWSEIVVVTSQDQRTGRRGSQLSVSPLKSAALGLDKVRVEYTPDTKPEFRTWELPAPFSSQTDPPSKHVLVTASFGRILTRKHLSQFQPHRRLNVHPSLLPQYRGPAPIQHSILNGDKKTGVCVIEMLEAVSKKIQPKSTIDAGGVWASSTVPQPPLAEFAAMRDTLAIEGGKLLVDVLRKMRDGSEGTPKPQLDNEEDGAVVELRPAPMITIEDAQVDPAKMTAKEIHVRWRAIGHQRPITTFRLMDDGEHQLVQLHDLEVTAADKDLSELPDAAGAAVLHKGQGRAKRIFLRCFDGSVLTVFKIKAAGKPLLSTAEYWNGLKVRTKNDHVFEPHKDNPTGKRKSMYTAGSIRLGVPSQVVPASS